MKKLVAVACAVALGACASKAENIAAAYVSPNQSKRRRGEQADDFLRVRAPCWFPYAVSVGGRKELREVSRIARKADRRLGHPFGSAGQELYRKHCRNEDGNRYKVCATSTSSCGSVRGFFLPLPHFFNLLIASIFQPDEGIARRFMNFKKLVELGLKRSSIPVLGRLQDRQQQERYGAYRESCTGKEVVVARKIRHDPKERQRQRQHQH